MTQITRIETDSRSSRVVIHGGTVFIGGMTAGDRSQGITGQTQQVLARIDNYLSKADSDKSQLLTAQIWLKDIARDLDAMNEVWNAWTAPGQAPTRATVQSSMASPDILIEIVVTAACTD